MRHMEQLDALHIKAARFVYRIRKNIPDNDVLARSGWLSFDHLYKQQIAHITYKLHKNQLPESFSRWRSNTKNQRRLRNNHRVDLPNFNKMLYKKSFAYRNSVIWNQLSNDCTESPSLQIFKTKLKNELATISFGTGAIRGNDSSYIYNQVLYTTKFYQIFIFWILSQTQKPFVSLIAIQILSLIHI